MLEDKENVLACYSCIIVVLGIVVFVAGWALL